MIRRTRSSSVIPRDSHHSASPSRNHDSDTIGSNRKQPARKASLLAQSLIEITSATTRRFEHSKSHPSTSSSNVIVQGLIDKDGWKSPIGVPKRRLSQKTPKKDPSNRMSTVICRPVTPSSLLSPKVAGQNPPSPFTPPTTPPLKKLRRTNSSSVTPDPVDASLSKPGNSQLTTPKKYDRPLKSERAVTPVVPDRRVVSPVIGRPPRASTPAPPPRVSTPRPRSPGAGTPSPAKSRRSAPFVEMENLRRHQNLKTPKDTKSSAKSKLRSSTPGSITAANVVVVKKRKETISKKKLDLSSSRRLNPADHPGPRSSRSSSSSSSSMNRAAQGRLQVAKSTKLLLKPTTKKLGLGLSAASKLLKDSKKKAVITHQTSKRRKKQQVKNHSIASRVLRRNAKTGVVVGSGEIEKQKKKIDPRSQVPVNSVPKATEAPKSKSAAESGSESGSLSSSSDIFIKIENTKASVDAVVDSVAHGAGGVTTLTTPAIKQSSTSPRTKKTKVASDLIVAAKKKRLLDAAKSRACNKSWSHRLVNRNRNGSSQQQQIDPVAAVSVAASRSRCRKPSFIKNGPPQEQDSTTGSSSSSSAVFRRRRRILPKRAAKNTLMIDKEQLLKQQQASTAVIIKNSPPDLMRTSARSQQQQQQQGNSSMAAANKEFRRGTDPNSSNDSSFSAAVTPTSTTMMMPQLESQQEQQDIQQQQHQQRVSSVMLPSLLDDEQQASENDLHRPSATTDQSSSSTILTTTPGAAAGKPLPRGTHVIGNHLLFPADMCLCVLPPLCPMHKKPTGCGGIGDPVLGALSSPPNHQNLGLVSQQQQPRSPLHQPPPTSSTSTTTATPATATASVMGLPALFQGQIFLQPILTTAYSLQPAPAPPHPQQHPQHQQHPGAMGPPSNSSTTAVQQQPAAGSVLVDSSGQSQMQLAPAVYSYDGLQNGQLLSAATYSSAAGAGGMSSPMNVNPIQAGMLSSPSNSNNPNQQSASSMIITTNTPTCQQQQQQQSQPSSTTTTTTANRRPKRTNAAENNGVGNGAFVSSNNRLLRNANNNQQQQNSSFVTNKNDRISSQQEQQQSSSVDNNNKRRLRGQGNNRQAANNMSDGPPMVFKNESTPTTTNEDMSLMSKIKKSQKLDSIISNLQQHQQQQQQQHHSNSSNNSCNNNDNSNDKLSVDVRPNQQQQQQQPSSLINMNMNNPMGTGGIPPPIMMIGNNWYNSEYNNSGNNYSGVTGGLRGGCASSACSGRLLTATDVQQQQQQNSSGPPTLQKISPLSTTTTISPLAASTSSLSNQSTTILLQQQQKSRQHSQNHSNQHHSRSPSMSTATKTTRITGGNNHRSAAAAAPSADGSSSKIVKQKRGSKLPPAGEPTRVAKHKKSNWIPLDPPGRMKIVYLTNTQKPVKRLCYSGIQHCSGAETVREHDCVMVATTGGSDEMTYIGKVARLFHEPSTGVLTASVLWYYRPEQTDVGRREWWMGANELFASRHFDTIPVDTIEDTCYVITFNEYARYKSETEADWNPWWTVRRRSDEFVSSALPGYPRRHRQPADDTRDDDVYFARTVYDFAGKRFIKNPTSYG